MVLRHVHGAQILGQAHENQAVFTLEAIKNSNRASWSSTKSEGSLIFKTESAYWAFSEINWTHLSLLS